MEELTSKYACEGDKVDAKGLIEAGENGRINHLIEGVALTVTDKIEKGDRMSNTIIVG